MCFSPQRRAIFDIRTSKSAPKLMCFVHVHFKMRFSPQRRASFRHQNFKKCSETVSFSPFWLQNVFWATAACNFSTAELQKVLRDRQFFNVLTSKCVFRHSAVQFLISPLTTRLRTRFNRPTFRLTRQTNHWKNTNFATSLTFGAGVFSFFWLSRYCIFFLLTWLLYSAFQLSILSEVCYLNFLRLYTEYTLNIYIYLYIDIYIYICILYIYIFKFIYIYRYRYLYIYIYLYNIHMLRS